jgi:hypothetical protein
MKLIEQFQRITLNNFVNDYKEELKPVISLIDKNKNKQGLLHTLTHERSY